MSTVLHGPDREVASGVGTRDDHRTMRNSSSVLVRAITLAIGCGLLAFYGLARSEPARLFWTGEIEQDAVDGRIRVRSGLVQIEIAPGAVVSAGSGSEVRLEPELAENSGARGFAVLAGEVRLVALEANVVYVLAPGRYRWQPVADGQLVALSSGSREAGNRNFGNFTDRQDVRVADSAMLRQNKLLQVDTTNFVRGIFSLFRR